MGSLFHRFRPFLWWRTRFIFPFQRVLEDNRSLLFWRFSHNNRHNSSDLDSHSRNLNSITSWRRPGPLFDYTVEVTDPHQPNNCWFKKKFFPVLQSILLVFLINILFLTPSKCEEAQATTDTDPCKDNSNIAQEGTGTPSTSCKSPANPSTSKREETNLSKKCTPPCDCRMCGGDKLVHKPSNSNNCSDAARGRGNVSNAATICQCGAIIETAAVSSSGKMSKFRDGGRTPVDWCDPSNLCHTFLIRQACQVTVDSVTRILCETVSAYQDVNKTYGLLLNDLMDALEATRDKEGAVLEVLDCKIIELRAESEELKRKMLEIESFILSVQKLAEAATEAAFLGNAEYASVALSERMQSAFQEISRIKGETERKEKEVIQLQSLVIVESGKALK